MGYVIVTVVAYLLGYFTGEHVFAYAKRKWSEFFSRG